VDVWELKLCYVKFNLKLTIVTKKSYIDLNEKKILNYLESLEEVVIAANLMKCLEWAVLLLLSDYREAVDLYYFYYFCPFFRASIRLGFI